MPAKSCHYSMKKHPLDFNGCSRTIFCLAAAVIFLFSRNAPAAQVIQTLPFYDSFDYNPAAGLANASSTVWETCYATSNIQVTNNNLTLTGFVPSAGNGAAGVTTKATRFAGTQFTSQTAADGKTVYFSFLYQIAAYPTTNGVIAFLDATNIGTSSSAPMPGTTALALLINHAGQVGINAGSPSVTGAQYEPSATPLNTTVLVVARYTFHTSPATDVVDLWINPNSANYGAASAPASDISLMAKGNWPSLADFTMSFNNGDSTFVDKWDEVRIGTTWAQVVPSSNLPGPASAAHSDMLSATPA